MANMTNKDFAIAVNKFFFYAMNYPLVEVEYPTLFDGTQKKHLPSFFNAFEPSIIAHYVGKWESAYKRVGSYGAINVFYGDLDGKHRAKMLKYINENFTQREDFGINLEEVEA